MFSYLVKTIRNNTVALDKSDEAFNKIDKNINFGTVIKIPTDCNYPRGGMAQLLGFDKEGKLWFQPIGERGASYVRSEKIQLFLKGKPIATTIQPLKDIVIDSIKKNADKIQNHIRNDFDHKNNQSYLLIYNTFINSGIKKTDAPALFEELITKTKEETLMDKLNYIQHEIQEVKQSHEEILKTNKLLIKQNQELLFALKNKNTHQSTKISYASCEQKLNRSSRF